MSHARRLGRRPAGGLAPGVYLVLLALSGPGLLIAALLAGASGGVRLVPPALGAITVAMTWWLLASPPRPGLNRIARRAALLAGVVAIGGVVVQLPLKFLLLVLPALGLLLLALAAWRARRTSLGLGFLPGVKLPSISRPAGVTWRQALVLAAGGTLAVGIVVWLTMVPVAGLASLSIVAAAVLAAWRGGARPAARSVTIMAAAAALALVPFRGLGEVSLGGAALGLSDFALGVALLAWWFGRGGARTAMLPRYTLGLAIFVTWLGITSLQAFEFTPVIKEMAKWAEIALGVALLADVLREERARRGVIALLTAAVLAQALVGLVQTAARLGPATFDVGGVIRAFGTFDQPNPFGGYLGLHIPFLLAAVIYAPRRRRGWVALAWLVVFAAIIASRSRGAWLGLSLSSLAVVLAAAPRARLPARAALVLVGVAFLAFVAWESAGGPRDVLPVVVQRVAEGRMRVEDVVPITLPKNYPITERVAQWITGWHMFIDRPLTGVGAGNFDAAYPKYFLRPLSAPLGHAHNVYLNFGAEAGLPGMLGIVALTVWGLLRAVWVIRLARGNRWEWLAIGTLGGSVALAAHNLVDSLFVSGMGLTFAMFIAVTYALEWQFRERLASRETVRV